MLHQLLSSEVKPGTVLRLPTLEDILAARPDAEPATRCRDSTPAGSRVYHGPIVVLSVDQNDPEATFFLPARLFPLEMLRDITDHTADGDFQRQAHPPRVFERHDYDDLLPLPPRRRDDPDCATLAFIGERQVKRQDYMDASEVYRTSWRDALAFGQADPQAGETLRLTRKSTEQLARVVERSSGFDVGLLSGRQAGAGLEALPESPGAGGRGAMICAFDGSGGEPVTASKAACIEAG